MGCKNRSIRTRFIEVNVDDLEFETNCIKTQDDLLATIERINSRNVTNKRFDLCVDGDDANNVLELTDFDWSAESDNEAIKTFITQAILTFERNTQINK